jgi:hypothetical protein
MAEQETLMSILLRVEDGKLTAISAKDKIKALIINPPTEEETRLMALNIYAKCEVKHNTFEEGFISGVSSICDYLKDK